MLSSNQIVSVSWKNTNAIWHRFSPVNPLRFLSQRTPWWDRKQMKGPLSQGKAWERKRWWEERKGDGGRAESQLYCCVFSQHQQQRKWNGAAKYTNGTIRQQVWSSCGTWLSPGPGVWKTENCLLFIEEELQTAFQIHNLQFRRSTYTYSKQYW